MAVLPDKTIAGVLLNAGFTGAALTTAVAVALAESGGDPNAHNTNAKTGDNSYGLLQINMLGSMGPERRAKFNLKNNEELFNPSTNARVGYGLYKARGSFGDWSTYNHGTYLRYMARAQKAVKENGGAAIATGTVDPTKPSDVNITDRPDTPLPDSIENTIYDLRDSVAGVKGVIDFLTNKDNWFRVGMFVGGTALIIVGILALIGRSKTAQTAVNVAKNVVPVGKVAKVVS